MESTLCHVRPSEKANRAFVSATSMSPRHERSTMPCGAASDERNSVARRNASFTMRCKCGASNGTSTSCWIASVIVLCTWKKRNAFEASSWKSCASLPQSGWMWHCGKLSARRVGLSRSRPPSHDALSRSSARLCAFAPRALHVHQPPIRSFRWHHAAPQTSSSFISDKVHRSTTANRAQVLSGPVTGTIVPPTPSLPASFWSDESAPQNGDEHTVENLMLCSFAHQACSLLLQGKLQEEQCGFDVLFCAGCAFPTYRMNIKARKMHRFWKKMEVLASGCPCVQS